MSIRAGTADDPSGVLAVPGDADVRLIRRRELAEEFADERARERFFDRFAAGEEIVRVQDLPAVAAEAGEERLRDARHRLAIAGSDRVRHAREVDAGLLRDRDRRR